MKVLREKRTRLMLGLVLSLFLLGLVALWMARSPSTRTALQPMAAPQRQATSPLFPASSNAIAISSTMPGQSSRLQEIVAELDTGQDAATGQELRIGMKGELLS